MKVLGAFVSWYLQFLERESCLCYFKYGYRVERVRIVGDLFFCIFRDRGDKLNMRRCNSFEKMREFFG